MALVQEQFLQELIDCLGFALKDLKEATIGVGVQEHPGQSVNFI